MKNTEKNQMNQFRVLRRCGLKKRLSAFLALLTVISMLSGQLAFIHGAETDSTYALAGEGSGEDITVHFGEAEDQHISIHVNPESDAEALAGYGSEASDDETESETEIMTGIKEVEAGELVTIAPADGSDLPEEAEAAAEIVEGGEAIAAVEEKFPDEGSDETSEAANAQTTSESASTSSAGGANTDSSEPTGEAAITETQYQVFDISLENVDTEQYEDGFKVSVNLPEDIKGARDFHLYHLHEGEEPEEIEISTVGSVDKKTGLEVVSGFEFVTEGFSEFVLKYTVDFHWTVDGKRYEFSIPGGGFMSFQKLMELLGVAYDTDNWNSNGEAGNTDADNEQSETVLTLDDIEVSEATREFVAGVESVVFSSPDLVDVSKVEADTTVGQIKENRGLEVQYSVNLTEEQIAGINHTVVSAGDWALISVLPFTSEESLTVTMKTGEVFTVKVTDAQITKKVLDSKGDTWEITVTYGPEAQIPDDAELMAEEILPEDSVYEEYYQEAVEKARIDAQNRGVEFPMLDYARMFDIEIRDGERKVEPSAPVQVSIRLVREDTEDEDQKETLQSVVHFAESGTETMELLVEPDNHQEEDASLGENSDEVIFDTQSFSVYAVVNNFDWMEGPVYALVNQWGPQNTIGSANNGGNTVTNYALMDTTVPNEQSQTLTGKGVYLDSNMVGGNVAEWGFEWAGGDNYGKALIYTGTNEDRIYITRNNNNLLLTRNRDEAVPFTVNVENGKFQLQFDLNNNRYYVRCSGDSKPTKFTLIRNNELNNNNRGSTWFTLAKINRDYEEVTARKVSAEDWGASSDVAGHWDERDTVIIYRKIVHEDGSENLYALGRDGKYVPIYDGGDGVYYHVKGDDKDLLNWHILSGTNGYYVFSRIDDNHTVYLSPSVTDNTWSLNNTPVALTMLGMGNGYGTPIEKWDQTQYAYAGLHLDTANLDEGVVPGIGENSDTFMFAVVKTLVADGELHTVPTVDSAEKGITIKMYNYGGTTNSRVSGHYKDENGNTINYRNDYMQSILGNWITNDWDHRKGLVSRTVDSFLGSDGYPIASTNHNSTINLFTGNGEKEANHLFLQSYYDENGMFRYSSLDNFASLQSDGNFKVYREPGTPIVDPVASDHYYFYHGHFMPYNDLDSSKNVSRMVDQYGNKASQEEGRTYENVYGIQGAPDYYFGMTMEAKFVQPTDGKLANGDPVIYRFTGDDDMWVFIDGVLVLDISGIHEPITGSINFETGKVYQPNYYKENGGNQPTMWGHTSDKTIYDIFLENQDHLPAGTMNPENWKDADGDGDLDTFADFSTHSFKMYYMERGAGASNLDVMFNLQVVKPKEFAVQKTLPEQINTKYVNDTYKFKAYYKDSYGRPQSLYPGAMGAVNGNNTPEVVCDKVYYKDRRDAAGNPVPVHFSIDAQGERYFELKAGETVIFSMTNEKTPYCVKEVDINGDLIDTVQINGQTAGISNGEASTSFASARGRGELNFRNNPYIQNLLITKHLYDEYGEVISFAKLPEPNPVFEFRVYLESIVVENGVEKKMLVPYANGPYYLMRDNEYYTLDRTDGSGNTNLPNNHGTTKTICSYTGNTGTINSIPPEYTIVIPDLIAGTSFYIEERRDNMPDGYEFVKEELTQDTYDRSNLEEEPREVLEKHLVREEGDNQEFDIETVGMIKKEIDAQSHVYNRKPLIDITVEKQWEDNGTDRPQAVSLKLKRYKKDIGENGGGDTPTDKKAYITIQHNSSGIENTDALPNGFQVTYDIIGLTTYRGVTADRYQVTPGSKYTVIAYVTNAATPENYTYLGTSEWQGEVSENNGEYTAALTSTYRKNLNNGEKRVTIPPATWNYKTVTGTGEYRAGDWLLFDMTVCMNRSIVIKLGGIDIDPDHRLIVNDNEHNKVEEPLQLWYQIPNDLADGTVLPLSIDDPWWALSSLNIIKVAGNNSTQQSAPAYSAGFNPALSPSLMNEGENNTTRDGSGNTNDQASDLPAGVPAGYVLDSDFDDDGEMDISLPLSDSSWSTIIENLDARGKKGYLYYYVLVEDDVPEGYTVSYENNPAYKQDDNEQGGATITAINTKNPGNLELTKQVVGNGADSDKAFEFTIVLEAPAGKTLSDSGYSFSGTMTGSASYVLAEEKTTATVSGISLKDNETFKIVGLPVGTKYTITEDDYSSENYQTDQRVTSGIISGGETTDYVTVTNSKYNVTVEVLKIDETTRSNDSPTIVPGAEFTLYKKNNEGRYEDVIGSLTTDTQNNGLLDFNNLSLGDYKLSETKIPAGFVKTAGDIFFTVKVNSSGNNPTVIWKDKDGGDEITGPQGSVSFSPDDNRFTYQFIVGNTPGAILPSTGGPGTNILYLIGCILTILAGVGIVMRRKRREAA